jgi:hypothetical protein
MTERISTAERLARVETLVEEMHKTVKTQTETLKAIASIEVQLVAYAELPKRVAALENLEASRRGVWWFAEKAGSAIVMAILAGVVGVGGWILAQFYGAK